MELSSPSVACSPSALVSAISFSFHGSSIKEMNNKATLAVSILRNLDFILSAGGVHDKDVSRKVTGTLLLWSAVRQQWSY